MIEWAEITNIVKIILFALSIQQGSCTVDSVYDFNRLQAFIAIGSNEVAFCKDVYDIAIHLAMITHRADILTIVIGGVARRKFADLISLKTLILQLIEVLPANLDGSFLSKDR